MKRIVRRTQISPMGIRLEVEFPELQHNNLLDLKTLYATIALAGSFRVTSPAFSTMEKAAAWLGQLTAEAKGCRHIQDEIWQTFAVLEGEEEV